MPSVNLSQEDHQRLRKIAAAGRRTIMAVDDAALDSGLKLRATLDEKIKDLDTDGSEATGEKAEGSRVFPLGPQEKT